MAENMDSMSGSKFGKLARDADVADAKLSKADIDLLFVRAQGKQTPPKRPAGRATSASKASSKAKLLDFDQFLDALYDLAARKYGRAAEPRTYAVPNGRRGLPLLLKKQ